MLRRKGYLKFYRKMRNVRRVPFIIVSIGKSMCTCTIILCVNAFMLKYLSTYNVHKYNVHV